MKVNEALHILKKAGAVITEGRHTAQGYRWGGYMFNKGNKNTKYVQVLNLLYWSKRTHDEDDGYTGLKKNWVHDMMGWSTNHGNHSSMWTELNQEGYVKYNPRKSTWTISDKGCKFLEDNDLVIPYNELTNAINGSDEPAEEKAPSKNILDILLQSLAIVSRSNAGGISVEDFTDQTALSHDDVEKGLLALQRHKLVDTNWNDKDGEENLWFITGSGALVLRNTDKIPVKGTTISDVASGRAEYEGAPAAKKPAIDLDDDIYDDTPVVKQRDESTQVNEGLVSDMGYKLFKRAVCSKLQKAGFDLEQYADQIEEWCQDWYQDGFDADDAFASLRDTLIRNGAVTESTDLEESRKFHKSMQEDFSMGVGAPCGLDQGIPHGGDCKGCNPCKVAMVGHPVSKPPRSAALALTPDYWLNQIPKKKKKKVKKMQKRNLRKEAYEYLRPLQESEDMNEGVFAIAGGVALGLIAFKALKTVCGIGKDVLQGVVEGTEEIAVPQLIEKNKVEIAEEIKNSIMNDSLYGEEVRKDLENKSLTKEKIKTVLQKQLHMGPLGRQKFTNRALDRAADSYHDRKLRIQGWRSGNGSFRETHDDIKFTDLILEKLTDITYAAIIDVKEEMSESYKLTESYGSDFEDFKEEVIKALGINRAIAKKLVNKFEDDMIAEFESTMDADKIAYDIAEYYYNKIG